MKKIISLILILSSLSLFSQQEAANWYFGEYAGINFNPNSGAVTSLNNGQLNTREGCASISDATGNLLFYTDGSTVYNSTHGIMSNGSGLYGDESSAQSAIIVPKPNNANIYYIFTVDNNLDGINRGLNYSEVNMSLGGGLGAVINKNINLLPFCSEKISAVVKDCASSSIWVVTLASQNSTPINYDTFHAYEVNDLGINTSSVISDFNNNINDARGYLKLSPDGSKLASANASDGLFLYDFNIITGEISNQQQLFINTQSNIAYGLEFSPNSQLLYVHSSNDFFDFQNISNNDNPINHFSTLTQFNLNDDNIQDSEFTLDERQLFRGGLQLGPNGKIYRSLSATYLQGSPFLGVINKPNTIGSASLYTHNSINLGGNNSTQGLPPFITSFFSTDIDIIQNGIDFIFLSLCEGESYTLMAENIVGANYIWTLDGDPIGANDFELEIYQIGNYEVLVELPSTDCQFMKGQAIVEYFGKPDALNASLFQCDEDSIPDGFTLFNLTEANADLTGGLANLSTKFFLYLTDAENSSNELNGSAFNNFSNPQTIYVQVIDDTSGCFNISELTLEVSATNANDASLEICDDDGSEDGKTSFNLNDAEADILSGLPNNLDVQFFESYENALLEVNPLNTNYTNSVAYSQFIYVRVENENACYGINEIQLTVFELPNIETELQTIYCLNTFPETITLTSGIINDSPSNYLFNWDTGENTSEIEINEAGSYTVVVSNANGCSKSRTITVLPSNIATIDNIEVRDASQNNTITVLISGEGDYEFALDNINGPYFDDNFLENVSSGIHTVFVRDKNDCGIAEELVSVIGFPRFFTPNNDGYNDTWQVKGVNAQFQPNTLIYIYDRYGKLISQIDPAGLGWNGIQNGRPLPNDDYWFAITLEDGRIFKDHFTLKR